MIKNKLSRKKIIQFKNLLVFIISIQNIKFKNTQKMQELQKKKKINHVRLKLKLSPIKLFITAFY